MPLVALVCQRQVSYLFFFSYRKSSRTSISKITAYSNQKERKSCDNHHYYCLWCLTRGLLKVVRSYFLHTVFIMAAEGMPLYFTAVIYFFSYFVSTVSRPNLASTEVVYFINASQNVRVRGGPRQKFGAKKRQLLDHFFLNFRIRHCISPEWNVAWTNRNATVNLQCVPYKLTYFPWHLIQKRLRSVCLLLRNIWWPLRSNHQNCDISS